MNSKSLIIQNLLRILTPEEINELTTSSSGSIKINLSDIMRANLKGIKVEDFLKDVTEQIEEGDVEQVESEETGPARILPFDIAGAENVVGEKVEFHFQVGQRVFALMKEFDEMFKRMDKNVLGHKRFPKMNNYRTKKQMSTLILEERKKMSASFAKIKSMEVMSLYKESLRVDVEHSKQSQNDFSVSTQYGVLVNKKQA